jgi:hypothetical protein
MTRRLFVVVLSALFVVACSDLPKLKDEPDTSPVNATAVMETHLISDGLKGFFPFEGTSKTYTRADMHRGEMNIKGTGTVTRFLIGTNSDLRIERLDKKLVYAINVKEKTYTECPLKGCGSGAATQPPKKEPEPKKEEKPADSGCKVKIASATFTVKQTGQKKNINNFDTEQYQAAWIISMQDPTARKTVSTLTQGSPRSRASLRQESRQQSGEHRNQWPADSSRARRSGQDYQYLHLAVIDTCRSSCVSQSRQGSGKDQRLPGAHSTIMESQRRRLRWT